MSLQRDKLYECAARASVAVLVAAGLMYLAVAGMNLAVLPAGFVEAEAWGSKVMCGASFALMTAFLALGGFLAAALVNRALVRWFLVAGTALLLAMIGGSIAFTSTVHDSVLGDGLFMGCNVLFGLVLVAVLATVAFMQYGTVENMLSKRPVQRIASKVGSVVSTKSNAVAPGDACTMDEAAGAAAHATALAPAANARLRARARERKIRFQRARKSR